MRKITCTLTFPDGKKMIATAAAKSADENVLYQYSGDVSRLMPYGDKGTLGFFEWYLKGIAANYGAEIDVRSDGQFQ
jgi:hypothetical protein